MLKYIFIFFLFLRSKLINVHLFMVWWVSNIKLSSLLIITSVSRPMFYLDWGVLQCTAGSIDLLLCFSSRWEHLSLCHTAFILPVGKFYNFQRWTWTGCVWSMLGCCCIVLPFCCVFVCSSKTPAVVGFLPGTRKHRPPHPPLPVKRHTPARQYRQRWSPNVSASDHWSNRRCLLGLGSNKKPDHPPPIDTES